MEQGAKVRYVILSIFLLLVFSLFYVFPSFYGREENMPMSVFLLMTIFHSFFSLLFHAIGFSLLNILCEDLKIFYADF